MSWGDLPLSLSTHRKVKVKIKTAANISHQKLKVGKTVWPQPSHLTSLSLFAHLYNGVTVLTLRHCCEKVKIENAGCRCGVWSKNKALRGQRVPCWTLP